MAYPYEHFNSIDDHKKPVGNFNEENFFSELENKCPSDDETQNGSSDEKNFFIYYRMLNFYVGLGMEVAIVHTVFSFKKSKWLEIYINFFTNDFEKGFYESLIDSFCGKTMENVRNRKRVEIIRKDDTDKITKQQPKFIFNGIHESYEIYDSYSFKQNEVPMDKAIYLGFSVLELSKLLKYETYYDKLQTYCGQEKLKIHYMDCDCFVLSIETQNINNDLKNLEDLFHFSNLNENHELISNKNIKL